MPTNYDNPRSKQIEFIEREADRLSEAIKSLPTASGRDSGGPEQTLALRKMQEASYWLGEARKLAVAAHE